MKEASATILLIEPDPDMCRIGSELFGARGYRVVAAGTAEHGRRVLRESRPDVVLVEPFELGPEPWSVLRSLVRERREVPFLAVTTLVDDRSRALAAGCRGFVAKPCSPVLVLREIEQLLGPGD